MDSFCHRLLRSLVPIILLISVGGCAGLWKEVTPTNSGPPQVRFDAAWFAESSSPDLVDQFKHNRQKQIEQTLAERHDSGAVETLSDQPEHGDRLASDVVSSRSTTKVTEEQPATSVSTEDTTSITRQTDVSHEAEANGGEPENENRGKLVIQLAGGQTFVR